MLNPEKIREDFPIFQVRKVTYLDNAATTHKPKQVINALSEFYMRYNSNVHRGLHTLSMEASRLYEESHEVVGKFINAEFEEVVFVRGATEALNLIAYMLADRALSKEDNVVTTVMEHHSNLLPWVKLSRSKGFEVRIAGLTEDHQLDYEGLAELIDRRTKVVAVTHMSNVLGTINDVAKISRLAHEVGAYVVVDGAQSVPHIPVDVKKLDVDFLAFSGHKMLGPTGIGVLYMRKDLIEDLDPPIYGGGIVEEVLLKDGGVDVKLTKAPWKFEAGTPHIAGALGLAEAVKYLTRVGMEAVRDHESKLTYKTLKLLNEELNEYVKVYGPKDVERRGGIVSFNVGNVNPNLIASLLDADDIAVRSGYHCAQPLHQTIKADLGSVRASFYIYNTYDEVEYFVNTLKKHVKNTLKL